MFNTAIVAFHDARFRVQVIDYEFLEFVGSRREFVRLRTRRTEIYEISSFRESSIDQNLQRINEQILRTGAFGTSQTDA